MPTESAAPSQPPVFFKPALVTTAETRVVHSAAPDAASGPLDSDRSRERERERVQELDHRDVRNGYRRDPRESSGGGDKRDPRQFNIGIDPRDARHIGGNDSYRDRGWPGSSGASGGGGYGIGYPPQPQPPYYGFNPLPPPYAQGYYQPPPPHSFWRDLSPSRDRRSRSRSRERGEGRSREQESILPRGDRMQPASGSVSAASTIAATTSALLAATAAKPATASSASGAVRPSRLPAPSARAPGSRPPVRSAAAADPVSTLLDLVVDENFAASMAFNSAGGRGVAALPPGEAELEVPTATSTSTAPTKAPTSRDTKRSRRDAARRDAPEDAAASTTADSGSRAHARLMEKATAALKAELYAFYLPRMGGATVATASAHGGAPAQLRGSVLLRGREEFKVIAGKLRARIKERLLGGSGKPLKRYSATSTGALIRKYVHGYMAQRAQRRAGASGNAVNIGHGATAAMLSTAGVATVADGNSRAAASEAAASGTPAGASGGGEDDEPVGPSDEVSSTSDSVLEDSGALVADGEAATAVASVAESIDIMA